MAPDAATVAETTTTLDSSDSCDDMHDMAFAKRGCCFLSSGSCWWERISHVPPHENNNNNKEEAEEGGWWARGVVCLKKLREWSELVAGPKWKTFIRRFNKKHRYGTGMKSSNGKFRYDAMSYSLNFDEGPGQNGHFDDDDRSFRDFSSRYASIPVSAKSSMDLGRNAPSFA